MVTLSLEQRALEFLAVEYERDGKAGSAEHIRTQPLLPNKARAVRAIAAALRQQPAPVDLEQVGRTDRELLTEFIRICREHKPVGQWPGERLCAAIERAMQNEKPFRFVAETDMAPERGHNGRGGDADRPFSGPRRAEPHQPAPAVDGTLADTQRAIIEAAERRGYERAKSEAPVVDDARMARALEWVRALTKPCSAEEREMLNPIEEAIAAYDPNCGARTVRVVGDAMREDAERYRWMRKHVTDAHANYRDVNGHLQSFDFDCEGDVGLDAAIDAARAHGVQS